MSICVSFGNMVRQLYIYIDLLLCVSDLTFVSLQTSVCLEVFADGHFLANLCEIPKFTMSTKLMLHVWNRDNFVAPISTNQDQIFDVWKTVAAFREVVLPPEIGDICRFAAPFRGGQNAIVRYEAGIGTALGAVDVVDFREVHTPCVPCIEPCDRYNCQVTCAENQIEVITLTLNNLQLAPRVMVTDEKGVQESKQVTYYMIGKDIFINVLLFTCGRHMVNLITEASRMFKFP